MPVARWGLNVGKGAIGEIELGRQYSYDDANQFIGRLMLNVPIVALIVRYVIGDNRVGENCGRTTPTER